MNGGAANGAMFILYVMRFLGGLGSAAYCFLKGIVGVVYFQRDIAHAVAMFADMLSGRIVGRDRRGQNEIRLALAHGIRSALTLARFQSAVGNLRKAEPLAVKVGCLPGVANEEFDVVDAFKLERVFHRLALPDSIFAHFARVSYRGMPSGMHKPLRMSSALSR